MRFRGHCRHESMQIHMRAVPRSPWRAYSLFQLIVGVMFHSIPWTFNLNSHASDALDPLYIISVYSNKESACVHKLQACIGRWFSLNAPTWTWTSVDVELVSLCRQRQWICVYIKPGSSQVVQHTNVAHHKGNNMSNVQANNKMFHMIAIFIW